MLNPITQHRYWGKLSLTFICVLLAASIVLTGCSATPVPSPSPPSLDAPAALPVSAHVNLAPYNRSKAEEFHNPNYLAATEGCAHASTAILLSEGQTVSLALESDCPIDWYGDWDNPRAQVGIMFPQMKTLTEDGGWVTIASGGMEARQIMASDEGKRLEVILTVHPDNSGASIPNIYKLLAMNLDPRNSHYLKYNITNGVASPPPGWKPSDPSPITLPRSPSTPEIMKFYITPDDPEVKAALNDILSGEWRWAYNDFNALREWVSMHVSYRFDQDVHGVTDYWQLPAETLELSTGDCEDFAILLCTLLRSYGVPADQVYVAIGVSKDKTYHGYLVEKSYKGIWRVTEPQADVWSALFLEDWLTSAIFEECYCFNDQDCFEGPPTLPPGVYEFEVGYSFWPATRGASVMFERHLNAGQKVSGSVEWLADRAWAEENYRIINSWSLYVYAPDGSTALSWSGTDLQHDFSFTPATPGTYKLEILKRDYLARCARLTIDPPNWQ